MWLPYLYFIIILFAHIPQNDTVCIAWEEWEPTVLYYLVSEQYDSRTSIERKTDKGLAENILLLLGHWADSCKLLQVQERARHDKMLATRLEIRMTQDE